MNSATDVIAKVQIVLLRYPSSSLNVFGSFFAQELMVVSPSSGR